MADSDDPMLIPTLSEGDYAEFLKILPELPSSYAAWLARQASVIATTGSSGRVEQIDITPGDFRAHLLGCGKPASATELWNCARSHGAG